MQNDIFCLDDAYSTTRCVTTEKPIIEKKPEDKFESFLFLPKGEARKGEGGLRTKGYFKKSLPDKPLITIITVVFNGENHLEETMLSVLNLTYDNVEYIIIDGGSTDRTLDIIKKHEDKIDYWVSEKDKGIYDAMNKGICVTTGDWINFMNAGDKFIFLDEKSLKKINVTNSSHFYDEQREKLRRKPFTKVYLTHNTPCHQSLFYKKDEVLLYNISYPLIADYEQMTKICKNIINPIFSEHIVFFAEAGVSHNISSDKSFLFLMEKVKIVNKNMGIFYAMFAMLHSLRIWIKK